MEQHLLSLFEIQNASSFNFSYRLVEIESAFENGGGDRDDIERNRNLLRTRVGYAERVPIALLRIDGRSLLAIPAKHNLKELKHQLIPHDVRLRPRDEIVAVEGNSSSNIDRLVRNEFLRFSLGAPLRGHANLWSATTTSYFTKSPINEHDESRDVDVYRGFGYRIVEQDGRIFVAVRLLHKNVDYRFIVDRRAKEGIEQLLRKRFLYLYGPHWYPVQLNTVLDKSIKEQTFVPDGGGDAISVYDWTIKNCGNARSPWIEALDPNSLAITYKSVGNEKLRYGAVALCKRMMPNNDLTAKRVHKLSILSPHERAVGLSEIVRQYLSSASFDGRPITVNDRLLRVERKVFPVPKIRFGQNFVISVAQRHTDGIPLEQLGKARMDALLSATGGIAVAGPPCPQHLLLPTSLNREIGGVLRERVEKAMQAVLKTGYTIQQSVFDDSNCRGLRQQLQAIKSLVDSQGVNGRGILVLPRNSHPRLHDYIKQELKDKLRLQCVDARQLGSYFVRTRQGALQVAANSTGDFRSYIRYVTVGLLLASGHKLWVLD